MVSFRRIVLAIAVLALFVGLASAQVGVGTGGSGGPLQCTASVAVPPQLRVEGLTDLIGDIVLNCTGGAVAVAGSVVPTANITVSLGISGGVTSRILTVGGFTMSEALLLVDEPGASGLAGTGPGLPQTVCASPAGVGPGGCGTLLASSTNPGSACTSSTSATCSTFNVYPGVVSGNQVTFNGIPVLAPATAGLSRVYRITNVRANVNGLGGGGLAGTTPLSAFISISGSTALPVNNPIVTAGFVQQGLLTAVRSIAQASSNAALGILQCNNTGTSGTAGPSQLDLVEFKENFATAFKTRVAATAAYNGLSSTPIQNVPGTIYNSESGFVLPIGGAVPAGLADYGTRLKASFNNVPAGVRIFVSTTNIPINAAANTPGFNASTLVTTPPGTQPIAVLVPSETGANFAGLNPPFTIQAPTAGGLQLSELVVANGSAVAVWEVAQANANAIDTLQFGISYTVVGNQSAGTPPAGTGTVNLSYAPTAGTTTFTAAAGATASSSLTLPRFFDTSTPSNAVRINLCQTNLLFPFVTNQNGFDTGLSIANTTTDPFGTTAQQGTCSLTFYGNTPPSALTTPVVPSGQLYVNTASTIAPGFQGYMIAVCNFQLAHGFAFVSDVGARNLAMGYLALVLSGGRVGTATETLSH